MTKSSRWLAAGAVAAFAALCACSSKSGANGNSGSSGSGAACRAQFDSACYSCLQSACGSQLGSFESDCSDYIECYCPSGAYSAGAQTSQACLSKVTANPNCISSAGGINSCVEQSCAGACQAGRGSSGDGGGGGSGGSGGGSSGGGGPVAACGIAFVAGSCASCVMANCCDVTQACAQDQACVSIISCLHQCNQSTTCESNCVSNAPSSAQMELNSAGSCWSSSCANSGC